MTGPGPELDKKTSIINILESTWVLLESALSHSGVTQCSFKLTWSMRKVMRKVVEDHGRSCYVLEGNGRSFLNTICVNDVRKVMGGGWPVGL